jgi:hypothetical protein
LSRVCQDIDLIKLNEDKIESVIEIKAGKENNESWKPYVKKFFPNWPENRLDDINYEALYKLAESLGVNLLLFRYERNKLVNGISFFKIVLNENSLNYISLGVFSLEKFIAQSKGIPSITNNLRNFTEVKDFYNPNITLKENIYHFIQTSEKLKKYYYVEREGIWTMLISNEVNLEPMWIYIELNISINQIFYNEKNNFVNEFFPAIEIVNKLQIPLSILAYDSSLEFIDVWEYNKDVSQFDFIKKFNVDEDFEKYYTKYIN